MSCSYIGSRPTIGLCLMLLAIIVVIAGCGTKPVDRDSELAVAAPCLPEPVFQEHPKLQVFLSSDKDHYRVGELVRRTQE